MQKPATAILAAALFIAAPAFAETMVLKCIVEAVVGQSMQNMKGDIYYYALDPADKTVYALGYTGSFGEVFTNELQPQAKVTDANIIIPTSPASDHPRIEISRVSGKFLLQNDTLPIMSGKCERVEQKPNKF